MKNTTSLTLAALESRRNELRQLIAEEKAKAEKSGYYGYVHTLENERHGVMASIARLKGK